MSSLNSFWAVRRVWIRYFGVFRKNLVYGLLNTVAEPFLYLSSFGFGLGGIIGNITLCDKTFTYRQFVLSGIIAQSIMFVGFFESAYGGFVRMHYQKIFKAMATTPITLSEVLWGELLWDASKATLSAFMVLLCGCLIGDFPWVGALTALPLCFLFSLLFAGLGLWTAAISESVEQISYPQYLFVFPMFLFCGVYFPIDRLPGFLQSVAWFLPLTAVASLLRSLTLSLPWDFRALISFPTWLVILVWGSRWAMTRRLIK